VVGGSGGMTAVRGRFEVFRFSVMRSAFGFSNIEILAVPAAGLVHGI